MLACAAGLLTAYYDGNVVMSVNCSQASLGLSLNALVGGNNGYFGIVGATGSSAGMVVVTEWQLNVNLATGKCSAFPIDALLFIFLTRTAL